MKIIIRQIYQGKSRQARRDLNSILTKWKWGNTPFKTSQEFLVKFSPWVQEKLKLSQEVEALLQRKGVERLEEIT